MDRRTFLKAAAAIVIAPSVPLPQPKPVTLASLYAGCRGSGKSALYAAVLIEQNALLNDLPFVVQEEQHGS